MKGFEPDQEQRGVNEILGDALAQLRQSTAHRDPETLVVTLQEFLQLKNTLDMVRLKVSERNQHKAS
jgi:hypothetical protein